MRAPSPNPLTPGYGFGSTLPPYSKSNPHKGTDWRYNNDHNVYAVDDGDVVVVPWNSKTTEGNMIIHTLGNRRWAYCHLDSFNVSNGKVQKGQKLGVMGATGKVSGAHLHVTMRIDGVLVNIMDYINEPFTGGNDMDKADNYFVQACAEGLLGRTAAGDQNLLNNVGRPKTDVLDTFRFYPEAKERARKANDYDRLLKENEQLKKQIQGQGTILKPGLYTVQ